MPMTGKSEGVIGEIERESIPPHHLPQVVCVHAHIYCVSHDVNSVSWFSDESYGATHELRELAIAPTEKK